MEYATRSDTPPPSRRAAHSTGHGQRKGLTTTPYCYSLDTTSFLARRALKGGATTDGRRGTMNMLTKVRRSSLTETGISNADRNTRSLSRPGDPLAQFESKSNRVKGITFHPRLTLLAASLHSGSIQLWNFQMGVLVDRFEEHDGTRALFFLLMRYVADTDMDYANRPGARHRLSSHSASLRFWRRRLQDQSLEVRTPASHSPLSD